MTDKQASFWDTSGASIARGTHNAASYIPGGPLGASLLLGGAGYGLGRIFWNRLVSTGGSLGRIPIRKMTGMSDDEYDEAIQELKSDNRYKHIIPAAIGATLGLGTLGAFYNSNRSNGGLLSWNPSVKTASSLHCKEELDKVASFMSLDGFVPELNMQASIDARKAQSLFSNDPFLKEDPYVKNMATSIVADGCIRSNSMNPTTGNIFDAAAGKLRSKFSLAGIADIGMKSMLANTGATLFTSALSAMLDVPKTTQRTIIDAGTWAGALTSILS